MKPTRVFLALLALLAMVACQSVDHVGVGVGATSQGDVSGSVQIYFRDASGRLLTARVPRSTVARTIAVPVGSDLDLPVGESVPKVP